MSPSHTCTPCKARLYDTRHRCRTITNLTGTNTNRQWQVRTQLYLNQLSSTRLNEKYFHYIPMHFSHSDVLRSFSWEAQASLGQGSWCMGAQIQPYLALKIYGHGSGFRFPASRPLRLDCNGLLSLLPQLYNMYCHLRL